MYRKFFGLKERPFQLVPNPAYLYLSRSHEEALAHLTYAISQGDGFVEITGEVGTGKTTLCRVFLESLNDNTEAAYIFNPKLDSVQLLKAVNDDFGIDSGPDTIKELIDTLNSFLLEKKAAGKKIILLIDEAQNLTVEVLEQLRLLSNLETTTSKLIQIILVGQPELKTMLESYELRQLGQRITLSCYLSPLSSGETTGYIRHRLYVASGRTGAKFSWWALREVYSYSGGIPRRINIVCDRAMLAAYVLNSPRITRAIVKQAIRELSSESKERTFRRYAMTCMVAAVCIPTAIAVYQGSIEGSFPEKHQSSSSEIVVKIDDIKQKAPVEAPPKVDTVVPEPVVSKPVPEPEVPEENVRLITLNEIDTPEYIQAARHTSLLRVLNQWDESLYVSGQLEQISETDTYFKLGARQNGFSMCKIEHDLNLVKTLNLPAIFEFVIPETLDTLFLCCIGIHDEGLVFDTGSGGRLVMTYNEFNRHWSGMAYVPWKNFLGCYGTIPGAASEGSVLTLKMLLSDIGYDGIDITPVFDTNTEKAVIDLQKNHGLKADGRVGALTKIILYNEKKIFSIPHLVPGSGETDKESLL